jgi:hypothetical protein
VRWSSLRARVPQRLAFSIAASALLLGFGLMSQFTPMGLQAPTAAAQAQSKTVACRLVGPDGEKLVTVVVPIHAASQIAAHGGGTVTTFKSTFTTVIGSTSIIGTSVVTACI